MWNISLLLAALLMNMDQPSHDHGIRSSDLRPRIGVISEEVVRQKLRSYGREIVSLEYASNKFIARVRVDGQPEVLEINRLTGSVMQNGKVLRMQPAANAVTLAIKPNPNRVPWMQRTIRFDKIGVEGLRVPPRPNP